MANTTGDDVALLKDELAQFLLGEIASTQGGEAFRREVGDQVAAVIDHILAERLKPALDKLERRSTEQAAETTARVDDALRRLRASAPGEDAVERRLAEIAASLDQLRQRLARLEEQGGRPRTAAMAQPIAAPPPRLADERIAAPRPTGSALPRWMLWLLLALLVLSVLGLGNLYYERLFAPDVVTPPPAAAAPQTSVPAMASTTPPPAAVSVPPQNTATVAPPSPAPPLATAPAPSQPAARIPADFAIERGWLAAQPYAVDPRLARRVGANTQRPTLKSIVCDASPTCTSDTLMAEGTEAKQLIALQMLMSQIGDRFCTPRRSVAVNGLVSAEGLADFAGIANCAGGAPANCRETQNKVCAPDADALQSGSQAARAALLRWALWKTGST